MNEALGLKNEAYEVVDVNAKTKSRTLPRSGFFNQL
jgi:hypothetical protein